MTRQKHSDRTVSCNESDKGIFQKPLCSVFYNQTLIQGADIVLSAEQGIKIWFFTSKDAMFKWNSNMTISKKYQNKTMQSERSQLRKETTWKPDK